MPLNAKGASRIPRVELAALSRYGGPAPRLESDAAPRPREAAARRAARLLRRRRPRRPDRRARARAATARRSTCARRSSTTSTSSSSCASAARSSSTSSTTRSPRARSPSSPPTASRPAVHADAERARPADDRRDLPARDQGPPRGGQVRRRGLHDRPHRPRRPRGGRGHDGRGARAHRARRDRGRRRRARGRGSRRSVAYISQTTLSVDETRAIIARLREQLPEHHRAAHRRHLLRHDQPPGGRQADGRAVRPRARDRLAATRRTRNRLVDVARDHGADGAPDRQRGAGPARSGSRASASSASPPARARPRSSSQRLVDFFRARGTEDVEEFEVVREDVRFMLPKTIRQALAARASHASRSRRRARRARGGRRADRRALAVEAQRRRGQRHAVGLVDRLEAELLGERERLVDVVDRARPGTPRRAQRRDPVRRPAASRERRLERARRARRACATRAALVAKRSSPASSGSPSASHRRANSAVVADRDRERPVGGLVGLVRRDARVAVAAPARARRPPSTQPSPG